MTQHPESDDQRADVLRKRAEAMASAQGWGLVTHACAIHHGHPHAEQMMTDDIAALESAGAMTLVLAALGDDLGDKIGHGRAIEALRQRIADGAHPIRALAEQVASSIGFDGERALTMQRDRHITAEFWGVIDESRHQPPSQ